MHFFCMTTVTTDRGERKCWNNNSIVQLVKVNPGRHGCGQWEITLKTRNRLSSGKWLNYTTQRQQHIQKKLNADPQAMVQCRNYSNVFWALATHSNTRTLVEEVYIIRELWQERYCTKRVCLASVPGGANKWLESHFASLHTHRDRTSHFSLTVTCTSG